MKRNVKVQSIRHESRHLEYKLFSHFELLRLYCRNLRLDLDDVTNLSILHLVSRRKKYSNLTKNTYLREYRLLLLREYCLKGLAN